MFFHGLKTTMQQQQQPVLQSSQENPLMYLLPICTYKDALVLEARQEGQGTYTTCQSLCHFTLAPTGRQIAHAQQKIG